MIYSANNQQIYGIDIGGANIKLSRLDGGSLAVTFPMWIEYQRLGLVVRQMLDKLNCAIDETMTLAITMTGEMADCFFTRREGVAAILDALTAEIPAEQCRVYAVGGEWLSVDQAIQHPWQVAASNWHALAVWLINQTHWSLPGINVVMDIGSTTVDIVPVEGCRLLTAARTDRQRLQLGQLVYTGLERTPVHAIVQSLWLEGQCCPVMAERFATSADVYLVLGAIAEDPENTDTADGRARTRQCALARIARMVGQDTDTLEEITIVELAEQIVAQQTAQIASALLRNIPDQRADLPNYELSSYTGAYRVLVAGHGGPIVARLRALPELHRVEFIELTELVPDAAARCAPALAVASLWAAQSLPDGADGQLSEASR